MLSNIHPEALILGGGIAGTALAILLARDGRPVTLIEQQGGPHHKVCGEFLSAEALHYLQHLGIDTGALGAVAITHLRFASGQTLVRAQLPFPARSLTRRTLDEALLGAATAAGTVALRGYRCESLDLTKGDYPGRDSSWRASLNDGRQICAPHAFLATGKHDLRGYPRPPGRQNSLIAFKQYFHLHPEEAADLASHVELHLFPGGYAGLEPVEPETPGGPPRANLCLLIDRSVYKTLGGNWPAFLAHATRHSPHLGRRLGGASPLLERPLALSSIPYGYLSRYPAPANTPEDESGPPDLWRLGDQTAVIPSFSGDGMSIALHTAHLAAALYLEGRTPADLSATLHESLKRQVTLATCLSRALVVSPAQPLIRLLARLAPGLLPRLATATRIRPEALLSKMESRGTISVAAR